MKPVILVEYTEAGTRIRRQLNEAETHTQGKTTLRCEMTPSGGGEKIGVTIETTARIVLHRCDIVFPFTFREDDHVLANGFQSWSETREYRMDEAIPPLVPVARELSGRSGDYSFIPYSGEKGEIHSHLFGWLRREKEEYFFGSTDESTAYGYLLFSRRESAIIFRKDCEGQEVSGAWTALSLFWGEGDKDKLSREWKNAWNLPAPRVSRATGWTSWYRHFTDITDEIILYNLGVMDEKRIPLTYFQIDDGWQSQTGDWLNANAKFPRGMKAMADAVKRMNFTPGIWWAPFVCAQESVVYQEHRDWLVSYDGEHLVSGGFNPGWGSVTNGNYYILDVYHPEVRNYLRSCAEKMVNEWGFGMVKCDFLFASALWPRRGKCRGRIMWESMVFLREILGDAVILGCGVPLGAAMGLTDYCRIGPDVGMRWEDKSLERLHVRERISTRNAVRNTLHRRCLDGIGFLNDPDVFILRRDHHHLSRKEQDLLFDVNRRFGSLLFTSDDVSAYPAETFAQYQKIFGERDGDVRIREDEDGVMEICCDGTGKTTTLEL